MDRTLYKLDVLSCSFANSGCAVYTGPFQVGPGLHTLTYFTLNTQRLDEVQRTVTFYVAPEGSTPVKASAANTGTNPTASAGGLAGTPGTPGTVTVVGNGAGAVGAANYASNPAGATAFDSTGTCSLTSGVVTFTGAGAGTCTVTATQPGNLPVPAAAPPHRTSPSPRSPRLRTSPAPPPPRQRLEAPTHPSPPRRPGCR